MAVNADLQPARSGDDLRLVVLAVGDAVVLQRLPGVALARVVEVVAVVVGRGDEVDAALGQDIGGGGRGAEIEIFDRAQPLVGEGTLEIAEGVFVVKEVLLDVGEGIAEVTVHRPLKIHGNAGGAGQRQIADKGEDEALGLGLRGRLRRGLSRRLGRGGGIGRHVDRRRERIRGSRGRGARNHVDDGPASEKRIQKTAAQGKQQRQRKQRENKDKTAKDLFHLSTTSLKNRRENRNGSIIYMFSR